MSMRGGKQRWVQRDLPCTRALLHSCPFRICICHNSEPKPTRTCRCQSHAGPGTPDKVFGHCDCYGPDSYSGFPGSWQPRQYQEALAGDAVGHLISRICRTVPGWVQGCVFWRKTTEAQCYSYTITSKVYATNMTCKHQTENDNAKRQGPS